MMLKMAQVELISFSLLLLHGSAAALNCTSPTPVSLFRALEEELFSKQMIRPVKSFSHALNVSIAITVVGIMGVDEKSQTLTTILWQVMEWDIEGLSWDEQECGTKRVSVPSETLWIPDVHIVEFMDEDHSPKSPYLYLYNTGHIFGHQPMRVVSSCKLKIYTFPFDIQNCSLTFRPHVHVAADMRMTQGSTPAQILRESKELLQTRGEWELVDISVSHSGLELNEEEYSEIKYFITLRRQPVMYVMNLLIPSCFLITVDLFSFLLPPQSVDRSSFKMTLILGYTVFLLLMNDLLPVTGETPLINVFFCISLILMVVSLLETVLITNIQFSSSQYSQVPQWLSVLVLEYLAVVVFIPPVKRSNRVTVFFKPPPRATVRNNSISTVSAKDAQSAADIGSADKPTVDKLLDELRRMSRDLTSIRLHVDKHLRSNNTSEEWRMMGEVIDRLLFGLYVIFISVSFIIIVAIWKWNGSYSA